MNVAREKDVPVLAVENVTKIYPDGDVTALCDVSLTIDSGEYVAMMGPSGSGKSTLLNLLGALDAPTRGEIYFKGIPLSKAKSLDQLRSAEVGFVFQSFHLLPNLTAVENVQMPMFEGPLSAGERKQRAAELLDVVGLGRRAGHLPTRLSVGERQRVTIARALANRPAVLLADEPTGNLDTHSGDEILDLFDQLHGARKMTIVVITHELYVARKAERLVRIRDGRIESDEPLS